MADTAPTFELKEPATPEALLPRDFSQQSWSAAAVLTLLVLVVCCVRWLRRRRTQMTPRSRRNHAYKEAAAALERITAMEARSAAVQTSLILRRYLSIAADDPALFETHEEFITRNDALLALSEPARSACAAGFARLAAYKYAPQVPASEATAVVGEARELLETLHRDFRN
ncbi:MAG: hypothetical protein DVB25_09445 [Verrucomicrobia bacterium]|nr:MAG: hypothetical protein DVB25_09445 [Verrucomicrobiota bacterium]